MELIFGGWCDVLLFISFGRNIVFGFMGVVLGEW